LSVSCPPFPLSALKKRMAFFTHLIHEVTAETALSSE
jgi:hypothetical protein